jgi:hypothetical protein
MFVFHFVTLTVHQFTTENELRTSADSMAQGLTQHIRNHHCEDTLSSFVTSIYLPLSNITQHCAKNLRQNPFSFFTYMCEQRTRTRTRCTRSEEYRRMSNEQSASIWRDFRRRDPAGAYPGPAVGPLPVQDSRLTMREGMCGRPLLSASGH